MLDDPEKVAAFEAMGRGSRVPGLKWPRLDDAIAGRKSVGEDLVEHRFPHPVGRPRQVGTVNHSAAP